MHNLTFTLAPTGLLDPHVTARHTADGAAQIGIHTDQDINPALIKALEAELGRVLATAAPGAAVACHLEADLEDLVTVVMSHHLVSIYLRRGVMQQHVADGLAGAMTHLLHREDGDDGDGVGRQAMQLPR